MNIVHPGNAFTNLQDWFSTAHGMKVADAFADEIKNQGKSIFSDIILQFGNCGQNPWLNHFSYKKFWVVEGGLSESTYTPALISNFTALPLDSNSVDCIIAPLTLEPYPAHQTPIDEMDRVLKPNGHIIFYGLNPHGLWGLQAKLMNSPCFKNEVIHLHSGYYLRREMIHRGYRPCFWSAFYYIPPVESSEWIDKLEVLNTVGKMLWSIPAGFYCFIVKKQTLSTIRRNSSSLSIPALQL